MIFGRDVVRDVLRACVLFGVLMLAACGGGGDAGTSISVSPRALNFSAEQYGNIPPSATVEVSYKGDGVIAGYPPATGNPGWLNVSQVVGSSPQAFEVVPGMTDLRPGTYHTTLRFVTGHADGSDVKIADVAITYVVSAPFLVSSSSLSFEEVRGVSVAAQHVDIVKANGEFSVNSDRDWLHAVARPNGAGGSIDVSVDSTNLAAGSYSGTLTVRDTSGSRGPLQIAVIYTLRDPDLKVDHAQFNFGAISDQETLPDAETVSVSSETALQIDFTADATYSAGQGQWLVPVGGGTTPAARAVRPATTAMPAGVYAASLHLEPDNGRPAIDIPVTYTLREAALSVSPSVPLNFQIDANSREADLAHAVSLGDDGVSMSWSAEVNVPWLVLSRTAGDTRSANTFTVSVPKGQLDGLANGNYSGSIAIHYRSPSIPDRTRVIGVSLFLMLPAISDIVPAFSAVNTSLPHVLHGEGFSSITDQQVHIGGQAVSLDVLSDNLARIRTPALAAGVYDVSVDNDLGVPRETGTLTAKAVPTYAAATLPRDQYSYRLLYDPGLQAVYSLDYDRDGNGPGHVRRYRYAEGSWQEEVIIDFPDIFDIEISGDGNTLYLAIDDGIYTLDLTNARANIVGIGALNKGSFYLISRINRLADGNILVVEGLRGSGFSDLFVFDPGKGTMTRVGDVVCGMSATSGDRTRAVVVQQCVSPSQPVEIYDVPTGTLNMMSYSTSGQQNRLTVDRAGQLQVVDDKVFDRDFNLMATLDDASWGVSFSPDSRRIVGLYEEPSNSTNQSVQVFDSSAAPVAGHYPLLATYPLNDMQPAGAIGANTLVSLDGRTVFIVAPDRFLVMPLPD